MTSFPRSTFDSSDPLPLTPEDITSEWLTKVLGVEVKDVVTHRIMHNTSSKVLIEVKFGDDVKTEIPTRLVVKGGLNPPLIAAYPQMKATYRREAEFYYYIAPKTDMNIPAAWFCGTDTVNGQGIVVMSDLTVDDVTFGEVLKTWSVEDTRAEVEEIAKLHAKTWGFTGSEHAFLASENVGGLNYVQAIATSLMQPEPWTRQFGDGRGPPVDARLRDRERVLAAWRTLWKTSDPRFRCFVHGDCHIGQTYIGANGRPGLVDWQGAHINSALHDVSFFINGILSIEDRKAHDKDIFRHYLNSLHKSGGPKIEFDDIWPEYQKHTLHGYLWALTPPEMQPAEQTNAISARYSAAIVDNESIELLESLPEYTRE